MLPHYFPASAAEFITCQVNLILNIFNLTAKFSFCYRNRPIVMKNKMPVIEFTLDHTLQEKCTRNIAM
jgi:hypothetical protein